MARRSPIPVTRRESPFAPPTEEEITRARDLYEQGFTVSRVLAATNMALGTLYFWLDGGPVNEKGERMLRPIPRRRVVLGKRRKPLKSDLVSLTARLMRTAEQQVRDIEVRLSRPAANAPARERDVRMLSMLTRTLRDLSLFAGAMGGETAAAAAGAAEPGPERVDELRAELARRINAIIAERKQEAEEGGGGP